VERGNYETRMTDRTGNIAERHKDAIHKMRGALTLKLHGGQPAVKTGM